MNHTILSSFVDEMEKISQKWRRAWELVGSRISRAGTKQVGKVVSVAEKPSLTGHALRARRTRARSVLGQRRDRIRGRELRKLIDVGKFDPKVHSLPKYLKHRKVVARVQTAAPPKRIADDVTKVMPKARPKVKAPIKKTKGMLGAAGIAAAGIGGGYGLNEAVD